MKKLRSGNVQAQKHPLKSLFPESYVPVGYAMAKSPHYQRTPEKGRSGSRESSPNFKPSVLSQRAKQNSASRHRSTSKTNSSHPLAQSGSTERHRGIQKNASLSTLNGTARHSRNFAEAI